MRASICTTVLLLSMISGNGAAQMMSSHAPTMKSGANAELPKAQMATAVVNDKPVAKVNGAVLTNRDLVREMYVIFPYGQQHQGFPPGLEPQIRKGALDMIVFEELVYQEAERRKMAVSPAKMTKAEADFKKQFPTPAVYQQYLKLECQGSVINLRKKIRRSMMIEAYLRTELQAKSTVTMAQAKAYYEKNTKEYQHGELASIQTISIIPPADGGPDIQKEAKKRAEDAQTQAKATKTYKEFGLLAEKMSDDDWKVNMGDRKKVDVATLPPPIQQAIRKMKIGEVSDLFEFGTNFTMFRLNEFVPAGRAKFEDVSKQLQDDMQKTRYNEARAELGKQLRKNAKIETL